MSRNPTHTEIRNTEIRNTEIKSERPLPEFEPLSDMSVVLPHLRKVQPLLFPNSQIVDGWTCSVRNRTYSQGKRSKSSTLIRYDLLLDDAKSGVSRRSELYLKAFLNGRGSAVDVRTGTSRAIIPELDAYAWAFPDDPKLAYLSEMVDSDRVKAHLPEGINDGQPLEIERLRYKPEDRCTLRIVVDRGTKSPHAVIAKTFSSTGRATDLFHISATLYERAHRSEILFKIPKPLALNQETATFWISELAGGPPTRASLDDRLVGRIAAGLVSFHRGEPITDGEPRTGFDQLAESAKRAMILTELFPALQPRLAELIGRLEDELRSLAPFKACNVHGAFRMRQLIVQDAEVGLIDFDSVARGDPLEDIVDMMLDVDLGQGHPDRARFAARFLNEYQAVGGEELDLARLRWHVPIQQLKRAYWLRHAALRRPVVAAELAQRVDRACDPATADLLEQVPK